MLRRALGGCLVALWVAVAPAAAAPTLGGRLSPVPMIWEHQQHVQVSNLSSVPVTVALELTDGGAGWRLAEEAFSLEPEQIQQVPVTAAGAEPATLSVYLTPVIDGTEVNSLELVTTLRRETFLDRAGQWLPWVFGAVLCFTMAGVLWIGRRRRQRR